MRVYAVSVGVEYSRVVIQPRVYAAARKRHITFGELVERNAVFHCAQRERKRIVGFIEFESEQSCGFHCIADAVCTEQFYCRDIVRMCKRIAYAYPAVIFFVVIFG